VVHELAAPVRFLAGWYEVLSLGVYPRLLRAIVSYPLLLRVCNSLTSPLNCRTRANPSPPNPLANTDVTLHPKFPFLHQLHTRVPFRNTPAQPALEARPQSLSSRPEQRRSLPLRSGGTTATNQPIHYPTSSAPSQVFPSFPLLSTYPLFLSFPFIFPLVEIPFSI
jgi:hypothetical protein